MNSLENSSNTQAHIENYNKYKNKNVSNQRQS